MDDFSVLLTWFRFNFRLVIQYKATIGPRPSSEPLNSVKINLEFKQVNPYGASKNSPLPEGAYKIWGSKTNQSLQCQVLHILDPIKQSKLSLTFLLQTNPCNFITRHGQTAK